jgi:hypothetical protein
VKHPIQPLVIDEHGTLRFQKNQIVRQLLDYCSERGLSLNELAQMPFSQADRTQLAQLIGYSLCGFHELSYVSDEDALAASVEAKKLNPEYGGCRDSGCEWHCGVASERVEELE